MLEINDDYFDIIEIIKKLQLIGYNSNIIKGDNLGELILSCKEDV